MDQEDIEVLLHIKRNVEIFNSSICSIRDSKINIKDINCEKISNILNTYNNYFDNKYINQAKQDMSYLLNNINETLKKLCKHEVEADYIDIYPEKSMKIYYCKRCFATL